MGAEQKSSTSFSSIFQNLENPKGKIKNMIKYTWSRAWPLHKLQENFELPTEKKQVNFKPMHEWK